jgi:hypothetical protein
VNGPITNVTIVYYHAGFVWAAREIASDLKVKMSAVKPLRNPKVVAGASGDDVIVLLGHDLGARQ